jgi:hypothetical protein
MGWETTAATLYYVEALDEGNPENKVDYRDEVHNGKHHLPDHPY